MAAGPAARNAGDVRASLWPGSCGGSVMRGSIRMLNPGAFGIVVNVMRGSARVAGYDWIAHETLPAAQISVAPYTPRLIEIAP